MECLQMRADKPGIILFVLQHHANNSLPALPELDRWKNQQAPVDSCAAAAQGKIY